MNSAGLGLSAPIAEGSLENIRHVFEVNLFRELEMPQPSRIAARAARPVAAEAVAKTIVRAVREGRREAYVSLSDAAAVMIKNLSPRLIDWGIAAPTQRCFSSPPGVPSPPPGAGLGDRTPLASREAYD